LAGKAASLLFTLGLVGTGMLGVPVLAGSCAYAVAEASAWRGSLERKPRSAKRFYGVLATAMFIGLIIDYTGVDAVKMLFWSAVINGILAPPLILLVLLLTSNPRVMGDRVNSKTTQVFGWLAFGIMTAAALSMLLTG
jgi:Mn2+/Fe2+ NRAMP family transporter